MGGEEEGKEVERVGDERKVKEKAKVETVICVTKKSLKSQRKS